MSGRLLHQCLGLPNVWLLRLKDETIRAEKKNSDIASSFFNSYVPRIRFQPWFVTEVFSIASICSLGLVV